MAVQILTRTDGRRIPEGAGEIRAFSSVRDERARLPAFLAHHRRVGVSRFFFADNGSTDGTLEFLLEQPDCHVFRTHASFREANFGMDWMNALLDEHGRGRWCLMLDADEHFLHPGAEATPIQDFAAGLGEADGVFAILLDMYGEGAVEETRYEPGGDLLEACPCFDSDYRWRRRRRAPFGPRPFPSHIVEGGPRARLFFPEHAKEGLVRRVMRRSVWKLGLPASVPQSVVKIPFVRWRPGARYLTNHVTHPLRLSPTTAVLLHFKFLADFRPKAALERARGEHARGVNARYAEVMERAPGLALAYAGTARYGGTEQLERLGLLRRDVRW